MMMKEKNKKMNLKKIIAIIFMVLICSSGLIACKKKSPESAVGMNVEDAKVMLEEMGYEITLCSDRVGDPRVRYEIGEVISIYCFKDLVSEKPRIELTYYNPIKAGDWLDIVTHDSDEDITSSCIIYEDCVVVCFRLKNNLNFNVEYIELDGVGYSCGGLVYAEEDIFQLYFIENIITKIPSKVEAFIFNNEFQCFTTIEVKDIEYR